MIVLKVPNKYSLIQQAKHPKRYTITHSQLYIIYSEKTIWLVFYLLKCLTNTFI